MICLMCYVHLSNDEAEQGFLAQFHLLPSYMEKGKSLNKLNSNDICSIQKSFIVESTCFGLWPSSGSSSVLYTASVGAGGVLPFGE